MARSVSSVVLDVVADVQGLLEPAELYEGMLTALERAVPCDWSSLNEMTTTPGESVAITRPPLERRWHELFAQHGHENPLFQRWLQTRDGRAYRFSDVAGQVELNQLSLFRLVYGPLGLRHQIAFTLPSAPDRVLAVALSRTQRDFSDREREILNSARPFLIQACRNALVFTGAGRTTAAWGPLLRQRGLTRRQAEVVQWVARGRSNRSIAAEMGISQRTVQKHLESAFRALGVGSRDQAAALVWSLSA